MSDTSEAPVLRLGAKSDAGIELDPISKARLEKVQVLIAFANTEVASAESRLVEVRDEIDAITVDTKRRLKALIDEKARLEAKSQSNKSNSERLNATFREMLRAALVASGVAEERIDRFQVRIDSDLNILSVTEDASKET